MRNAEPIECLRKNHHRTRWRNALRRPVSTDRASLPRFLRLALVSATELERNFHAIAPTCGTACVNSCIRSTKYGSRCLHLCNSKLSWLDEALPPFPLLQLCRRSQALATRRSCLATQQAKQAPNLAASARNQRREFAVEMQTDLSLFIYQVQRSQP
jgi:hypothetical protein